MRPVNLSAATTVDMTREYFDENDILLIPTIIIIDGEEYADDYEQITPRFLYDKIREGKLPTTSGNGTMDYYENWKKIVEDGYDIVHIDLSSGLSGTHNSAVMAADMIEDEVGEKRVYVPDTLAASSGEGLILDYANDLKNEGKSAREIYDCILKDRKKVNRMKQTICSIFGVIGSAIATLFGGWDAGLATLLIFMALDYVTGLIVAGVFHNSTKTDTGTLESKAGWKGLCRKCMTLIFVLVAYRIDLILGLDYIRNAVIIAFITNELISLVENAGLMGVPLPAVITKAIDILQKKSESEVKKNE